MPTMDTSVEQAMRDLGLYDECPDWTTQDEVRDVLEELYWQGYEARAHRGNRAMLAGSHE